MTPEEILLREQLYHERKDRVLEVLTKCNETMAGAKRYYNLSANYIDKIAQLATDEESTVLKPDFDKIKEKFEGLRYLIAQHNYPFLEKAHDYVMRSENSPALTAEEFATYMNEAERNIKLVESTLQEQFEKRDKEYDDLLKQLKNQRSSSPKEDTAVLESLANLNIQ